MTAFKDLIGHAAPIAVGGTGPGSNTYDAPRVLAAATGANLKAVAGYPTTNDVRVGVERGEIQGMCLGWESVQSASGEWLKDGYAKVFVQNGTTRHPDLKDVPLALEFARDEDSKTLLRLVDAPGAMAKPFALPPGVDAGRVAVMRDGACGHLPDPMFLEEAEAMNLEFQPKDADQIQRDSQRGAGHAARDRGEVPADHSAVTLRLVSLRRHSRAQESSWMTRPADLRDWIARIEKLGELQHVSGAALESRDRHDFRDQLSPQAFRRAALRRHRRVPARLSRADRLGEQRAPHGGDARPRREPRHRAARAGASRQAACSGRPRLRDFEPELVETGPILENVVEGRDVDLTRFPAPLWHEHDGGRYIGTGVAVVTSDPDTGRINLGAYRMMIQEDGRSATINAEAGKQGRAQYDRWFAKAGKAPVLASFGHDPLLLMVAGTEVPNTISEYAYAGAMVGQKMRVVRGEVTGLPMPADAEIVVEGWIRPDRVLHGGAIRRMDRATTPGRSDRCPHSRSSASTSGTTRSFSARPQASRRTTIPTCARCSSPR